MNKRWNIQIIIGIVLLVLALFYATRISATVTVFVIAGLMAGYVFTRSRFGFAGGVKLLYMTGQTSLTTALFVMLTVTSIGVAALQFMCFKLGIAGPAGINFMGSVKNFDIGVVAGGFLFGCGMIFSGGCASGTLTDMGEGAVRALITYLFYLVGTPIGYGLRILLRNSSLKDIALKVYFPDYFGQFGSILFTAFLFLILYFIVISYSKKRKEANTYVPLEYEDIEKPLEQDSKKGFFSYQTYHKLFVERWSFLTGGLILSIIFLFVLLTSGKSWGVTGSYTVNGVWLFSKLGIDFASIKGFEGFVKQAQDITIHAGTLRNTAIVIGSAIAFLLAGRFSFVFKFKLKDAIFYALGGVSMGIGAMFALGCNIGGLYSGIANFSLHGWGFMVFMVLGALLVLKIFEGKLGVIPKRKK